MKLAILAFLPFLANAQTPYLVKPQCLPAVDWSSQTSSPIYVSWNSVGVCVQWYCYEGGQSSRPTYCGSWAEQAKVGARIDTIRKNSDPLKSLQDAGKRFTIVPLDHPSMAGMPK